MPISIESVTKFVNDNITAFHDNRIESLNGLNLKEILKRKNPYLFKAKNLTTAQDMVKNLLDSYLSSKEETIFGEFLEKLAIFCCAQTYGGYKSGIEGIDLEFEKDNIRYIVSIKSGPNWGNSSQIQKMKDNFKKAQRVLRTTNSNIHIVAVNGCCYGKDNKPDKGDYFKYCGQEFWTFITGENDFIMRK